jgi:hypothetical protein
MYDDVSPGGNVTAVRILRKPGAASSNGTRGHFTLHSLPFSSRNLQNPEMKSTLTCGVIQANI